jgi:adenosine deaminase
VGHGTTLLDDPAVLDLVLERDVTVEACVTSNVHVGAVASAADHPLPRWLALGVRACVCTDNTLLSEVTAPLEHEAVRRIPGMTDDRLARAVENGHAGAFSRRR